MNRDAGRFVHCKVHLAPNEYGDNAAINREQKRSWNNWFCPRQLQAGSNSSNQAAPQSSKRIGDIGIATTPNETYALTGLKVKLQSPLTHTMVIELANGGDGYIPPPEQHRLGGYNTWPASSRFPDGFDRLFPGGRCDRQANWEGRLDEIAVFDRALSPEEVKALWVQ